jgi:Nucleotidyl transferase AbiEii toxin, Type IV TA system
VSAFNPKTGILPDAQLRLWCELGDLPPGFTLYGGTAVALHLGHRESIDFDFFGRKPFAPLDLIDQIAFLRDAKIIQSEPNALSVIVDRDGPVKLSFFGVPKIAALQPPHIVAENGIAVASLLDLAGTKAKVVQQRAEAKDYIDIDAILTEGSVTLPMALSAACAIYGDQFAPVSSLKALTYFEEAGLRGLTLALKTRLIDAVRRVDLDDLPITKSDTK